MIIQGSNEPIQIIFDDEPRGVSEIYMALYDDKHNLLKQWTISDMSIDGSVASAPLLESETMSFPPCVASLEIKWLESDGAIMQVEPPNRVRIVPRFDTRPLTSSDTDDESEESEEG